MWTKECPGCFKVKPYEEFHENASQDDGLAAICKLCARAKAKRYYANHRHATLGRNQVWIGRNIEANATLLDAFRSAGCRVCGEKVSCTLTAHHVDPKTKSFQLSQIRNHATANVKAELAKCVCLCHNCHAKVHAGLLPSPTLDNAVSSPG